MKRFLDDKRIDNTWQIIPISELPKDFPVIGISEYHSKDFAEFHMVEYCLIPKNAKLNSEQNPERSVATEDDSSTKAK